MLALYFGESKGRRTLGAKRVDDIFPKSVEELVGSYFRGGKHGKCVNVPQIVRNVPIWYISGRRHKLKKKNR